MTALIVIATGTAVLGLTAGFVLGATIGASFLFADDHRALIQLRHASSAVLDAYDAIGAGPAGWARHDQAPFKRLRVLLADLSRGERA